MSDIRVGLNEGDLVPMTWMTVPWRTWRFVPQPDITAYELAVILTAVSGLPVFQENPVTGWTLEKAVSGTLMRHFVEVKL